MGRKAKGVKVGDFAHLDLDREVRTGIPEVVIAEGKRKEHLMRIAATLLKKKGRVIITRAPPDVMEAIDFPEHHVTKHAEAGICVVRKRGHRVERHGGTVVILAAGTSDFAVGEEARVVAEELGCKVRAFYDIGVAGVHRLFDALGDLSNDDVDVYIVLAGREGALPTLVAGLVGAPVIGVPVSTGYGKGGRGEAALMAMLQSCSPLVVVNIDAGFVAGAVAARIAERSAGARGRAGGGPGPGRAGGRRKKK